MDIFLRTIAIIIEILILVVITYSILHGVGLAALDFGAGSKYKKAITMALLAIGTLTVAFFIAHLTAWYPTV